MSVLQERIHPPQSDRLAQALLNTTLLLSALSFTAWSLSFELSRHTLGLDFHGWYWPAASRVLHGLSPYTVNLSRAFDYPAFGALAFVPFSLIGKGAATVLFELIVCASLPATLWLAGVRDWRVYAITLAWQPVAVGWETANVSLPLACALAGMWRWRERPWAVGLLLAGAISFKILLAPLLVWLLLSRRWRALAWALLGTAAINILSWGILGYWQLGTYVRMLGPFTAGAEHRGYSLIGLAVHLGASVPVAEAIGVTAAAGALIAAVRFGRSDERTLLCAATLSCLLVSPLVESHYLTLLLVPLALLRPRLSPAWALPVVLILTPADHPLMWQHVLGLLVAIALPLIAARPAVGTAAPRLLAQPRRT